MWNMLEDITNVNHVNINKDERTFSLIGGAILFLYALIRIPFTAVLALLAALYLFFRGVRGFCYIYDRLGQNTAVQLPTTAEEQTYHNGTAVQEPATVVVATSHQS